MRTSNLKSKVVHYGRWRIRFFSAAIALAVVVLLWFKGEPGFARWIGMAFLGVVVVLCLLPSESHFDFTSRVVERRWKFLGALTVYRHRFPLTQFRQICWQSFGSWDQSSLHNAYAWKVGLESISGRRVFVSCFNAPAGRVSGEARQFAIELSKLTGIPLSHEIEAG